MYSGEGMKPLHETHASARGAFDNIYMNGQEVFKFAVRAVPTVIALLTSLEFLDREQDSLSEGSRSSVTIIVRDPA